MTDYQATEWGLCDNYDNPHLRSNCTNWRPLYDRPHVCTEWREEYERLMNSDGTPIGLCGHHSPATGNHVIFDSCINWEPLATITEVCPVCGKEQE